MASLAVLAVVGLGVRHWLQVGGKGIPLLAFPLPQKATPSAAESSEPDHSAGVRPQAGDPLIGAAVRNLYTLDAIECKIRQRVDLFGQQLTGIGRYQQLGNGPDRKLRLELKFQIDDRVASLQQVSDGRFFWVRQDLMGEPDLSRVDLRFVRETLEQNRDIPPSAAQKYWTALGGLARLLAGLREQFAFDLAHPRQFDGAPVWVVAGVWKPEALETIAPEAAATWKAKGQCPIERLPAHLPDFVVVVLGQDARVPLFPYRIEFRRTIAGSLRVSGDEGRGSESSEASDTSELTSIDLFEVNPKANLDPQQFVYNPGDQEVRDDTEKFLHRLTGQPPRETE